MTRSVSVLSNPAPCAKSRAIPAAAADDLRAAVHRDPDVLVASVKGRKAEPDHVGSAEIACHAGTDQRLADFEGIRMAEGDVAAAAAGVPRRDAGELRAAAAHQLLEQV